MSRSETGFEIAADGGEERCGRYGMRLHALVHEADQILRHRALIQGRKAGLLELVGKLLQLRQAVELPRLRRAPVQAKMVAIGFVEVSSPRRWR